MRMKRLCAAMFVVVFAAGMAGCSKDKGSGATAGGTVASASAPAVAKPGEARRIPIEAGQNGFEPSTIEGKPGEKLVLVFTRTVDGDCMSQVKFDGQKPVELPKDTAVDVPVTVPQTGKMQFACAMDMNTGIIVAKGS